MKIADLFASVALGAAFGTVYLVFGRLFGKVGRVFLEIFDFFFFTLFGVGWLVFCFCRFSGTLRVLSLVAASLGVLVPGYILKAGRRAMQKIRARKMSKIAEKRL